MKCKTVAKRITFLTLFCLQLCADNLVWTPPEVLSTAGQTVADPRIAMDGNGNLVAVWIENNILVGNSKPLGGSWGFTPTSISSSGASSPQLVVDPAGNGTAIWNQNGTIEAAILPLNGSWGAPVSLSDTGSSDPQIAVDPSGNLVAIWVCNGVIQSATKLINGDWSPLPDTLSSMMSTSDSPQIDLGDSGKVVAVWHELVDSTDTIFTASKMLDGTWSDPQSISNPVYPSVNPQVAVDPTGNVVAAWFRYTLSNTNYSNVIVQTTFLPMGGSWTPPADLSNPGVWNPLDLTLKVRFNAIGVALSLWNTSYDNLSFTVEGSAYGATGWIPTITFISSNLYAYALDFSVSEGGYAYGAYMVYNAALDTTIIQTSDANTYSSFANIGDVEVISSGGSNGYPSISGILSGSTKYAGAIWLSNDGSDTVVQSSIGQGEIIAPPTHLTVTQNSHDFGIFTEYYNTLTWKATASVPIGGFQIYRNGVLIGSVAPSLFTFDDHNRVENEPVVYGVAILEMNGNQSPISFISFP